MLFVVKPALLLALSLVALQANLYFSSPSFANAHCASCGTEKICRPQKALPSNVNSLKYPKLLVFVSFSMPTSPLKELARQVKILGGALVFRGLVEGSFRKTAERLKELGCEALIDPTLFEAYSVTAVPAFILRQSVTDQAEQKIVFDRIAGNVSLHYVLEEFATKGDVGEEAVALLRKLEEKR